MLAEGNALRPGLWLAPTLAGQQIITADHNHHKERLVEWLLANETYEKAIIFTNTRVQADRLGDDPAPAGLERAHDVAVGLGGRRRRQQERVLEPQPRERDRKVGTHEIPLERVSAHLNTCLDARTGAH